MSETMDYGIIQMPFDMAMSSELSRIQFYNRAQALLKELQEFRDKALSTPIDNEPQPIMYKLSEAEHEILKSAQLSSVTVLQPTPPTTELADDAILELADSYKGEVLRNRRADPLWVFKQDQLLALAKALLSRKSESEAVAEIEVTNHCIMNMKQSLAGIDNGVHKVYLHPASPQPSDDKMRELELIARSLRVATWPDPSDEREVSADWLRLQMNKAADEIFEALGQ